MCSVYLFTALQTKLNEEKMARQKADQISQEKERQISMLSVDYRQIQQRLQKLEGELRQVNRRVQMFDFKKKIYQKFLMHIHIHRKLKKCPHYTRNWIKSKRKRVHYYLN